MPSATVTGRCTISIRSIDFPKEVGRRSAHREGVNLLEDVDSRLHRGDVCNREAALAGLLADFHAQRILLQVGNQAPEHRALIVGLVRFVDEIEVHKPLLERDFLNTELTAEAPQPRHADKFGTVRAPET